MTLHWSFPWILRWDTIALCWARWAPWLESLCRGRWGVRRKTWFSNFKVGRFTVLSTSTSSWDSVRWWALEAACQCCQAHWIFESLPGRWCSFGSWWWHSCDLSARIISSQSKPPTGKHSSGFKNVFQGSRAVNEQVDISWRNISAISRLLCPSVYVRQRVCRHECCCGCRVSDWNNSGGNLMRSQGTCFFWLPILTSQSIWLLRVFLSNGSTGLLLSRQNGRLTATHANLLAYQLGLDKVSSNRYLATSSVEFLCCFSLPPNPSLSLMTSPRLSSGKTFADLIDILVWPSSSELTACAHMPKALLL